MTLKLLLNRERSTDKCTIGRLYLNGVFECYTLEDIVRAVKIPGETAIPAGVYTIIVNDSPRFKCAMPLLLGVPHFSGVRIHPGNYAADTDGCILVGDHIESNSLLKSRIAYGRLFAKIEKAFDNREEITIEIKDGE